MISTIVSRLVILIFGTLYPAYASYKAVRTKNVKEYVKWMMYWIVFALFTCAETFTDVFLSWFPFYYEIKIILVLWLLSPATKGSSILYRKFVHPMLSRREQEIDDYIAKAKEQGYHTVLNLGTKGVNYATTVIMQTAIKGGGGIVNQLRKSYSLSDLTDDTDSRADARSLQDHLDEQSDVVDPRHVRRRHSPRRSASGSARVDLYFPEVDVRPGPSLGHVRSTEDVSSGYSSAEPLYVGQPPKLEAREGLVRTASVGGTSRPRTRTTRTSLSTKKTTLPEDSEASESDSEITVIRYVSKTSQKIKRTSIIYEDNDTSENSNEFEDTIGFPIESIPVKQEIVDVSIEIRIPESVENIEELISTQSTEKVDEIINNELELLNNDESSKTEVKIERELSVDIFEDSIETNDSQIAIIETTEEPLHNKNVVAVEASIVTSSNIDSESLTSLNQRGGKYNKHTAPIPPIPTDKQEITLDLPINEPGNLEPTNSTESPEEIFYEAELSDSSTLTPEISNQQEEKQKNIDDTEKSDIYESVSDISELSTRSETHPIKATLVLKPGIIKSVGPPTEQTNKTQIFVSQSPKGKRKVKSKHESPISKLMMLPKKIFKHKGSHESLKNLKETIDKRKSWHVDTRSLTPSSAEDLKSKSDTEDHYEPVNYLGAEKKSVSAVEIANQRHEENKMILRTLSHSPKQYRRKTNEDYDYEDSD